VVTHHPEITLYWAIPYLSDSGLLSYLIGLTEKTLSRSPFAGAVLECYSACRSTRRGDDTRVWDT
jgi:hypothetical protein